MIYYSLKIYPAINLTMSFFTEEKKLKEKQTNYKLKNMSRTFLRAVLVRGSGVGLLLSNAYFKYMIPALRRFLLFNFKLLVFQSSD